jgi:hypothetical protein
MSETDLPTPEEFDQQQMQIAVQALQAMFSQVMNNAKVTGVAPDIQGALKQAPGAITKAQAEDYNPELIPKEEQAG